MYIYIYIMILYQQNDLPFLHSTKEGWSMMSTSQGRSRGGRPFGGSRNPWAFEGVSPVYITRLRAEDSNMYRHTTSLWDGVITIKI